VRRLLYSLGMATALFAVVGLLSLLLILSDRCLGPAWTVILIVVALFAGNVVVNWICYEDHKT
jgi:hypothetical protein